jgi:hypothetical protein
MDEYTALAARIFSDDRRIREEVTGDEIRRYYELERQARARRQQEAQRQREREQILAQARETRDREERESLRGAERIRLGLNGV